MSENAIRKFYEDQLVENLKDLPREAALRALMAPYTIDQIKDMIPMALWGKPGHPGPGIEEKI